MTIDTVTPATTTTGPNRNERSTFSARMASAFVDMLTFIGELVTIIPQFNSAISSVNASEAAVLAATDAEAWVSGGSYTAGDVHWSLVNFRPYRAKTTHSGETTDPASDTTNWAPQVVPVGDHQVYVTTGNGHGSTNTRIRRFSVTQRSTGTAVTYADSSTDGASFTINDDGLYLIEFSDYPASDESIGISVNSAQLTTGIGSITAANRLAQWSDTTTHRSQVNGSTVAALSDGDVVRAHTSTAHTGADNLETWFKITKIGFTS